MPKTVIYWTWEDAFSKFGFGDGDSWNGTSLVSDAIEKLGYETECDYWGTHNYMIMDIKKDGKSILFDSEQGWTGETIDRMNKNGATKISEKRFGYTDPHVFLPDDILVTLKATFSHAYFEEVA